MQPERLIQRAIRQYLARRGYVSVAVPNGSVLAGGKLERIKQMAALKADGLMPGFPDLMVFSTTGKIGFIEVKTDKGKLSAAQDNVRQWLTRDGFKWALCRSVEDAQAAIKEWGWI